MGTGHSPRPSPSLSTAPCPALPLSPKAPRSRSGGGAGPSGAGSACWARPGCQHGPHRGGGERGVSHGGPWASVQADPGAQQEGTVRRRLPSAHTGLPGDPSTACVGSQGPRDLEVAMQRTRPGWAALPEPAWILA